MLKSRIARVGTLSLFLGLLSFSPGKTQEKIVPLDDFMGCWMSISEPTGVIVQFDAFKKDGYSLSEEFVMMLIEPVEGGAAYRNVVKGTLDVWSDTGKYYMPIIYYDGVYDPVRGVIITDSTLYLVDDQMIFVHHRTTEKSSDRAVRYLDRVACDEIEKKRTQIHKDYKNLLDSSGKDKLGG